MVRNQLKARVQVWYDDPMIQSAALDNSARNLYD